MKYFATLLLLAALFVACSGESSDPISAPDLNGKISSSSVESGNNLVKSSSSITSGASSSSVTLWDVNVSSSYIESSSSLVNSSSSEQSSSSVTLATPCKTEMEDNCEYGELLDDRDGQTYKTVKIGDQVWMAENLNYKTDESWCGGGEDRMQGDCSKYGRLYTWAVAIDSVKLYKDESIECGSVKTCALPDTVYGICPLGWHLPDTTEWNTLLAKVGGIWPSTIMGRINNAGLVLKSQTDWVKIGSDVYGFSVLPAGSRFYDGSFTGSLYTIFWSASDDKEYAYGIYFYYDDDDAHLVANEKAHFALSVRCIKNEP